MDLPGCVWSIAFTGTGDVVAATSDYQAYIFSGAIERHADASAIAAFESVLAERKAPAQPSSGAIVHLRAVIDGGVA